MVYALHYGVFPYFKGLVQCGGLSPAGEMDLTCTYNDDHFTYAK